MDGEEAQLNLMFQHHEKSYINGYSKFDLLNDRVTKEECGQVCLEDQDCKAFEYGVDYGSSDTQIEPSPSNELVIGKYYRLIYFYDNIENEALGQCDERKCNTD